MTLLRALQTDRSIHKQVIFAAFAGLLAGSAFAAGPYVISQKNREFQPAVITIKTGEVLRFINDDGELLHHAYLNSPMFKFDSGDQKPGGVFDVTFSAAGNFTVRCAIHPKMKLTVTVE